MNIARLNPRQSGKVAAFIARLQADPAHHIAYFGDDAAEIAAALAAFDPPYNALLAYADDRLIGFLGVDADAEGRRAWLYGPLVAVADWDTTADALYDQALRREVIPSFVRDEELFVNATNTHVAAFAARHRFIPGTPQTSLRLDRAAAACLPVMNGVSELTEAQHASFVRLHDSLFPDTYYSGEQIIARLGERDRVWVAAAPGVDVLTVGYIYAKIDPEARDGYIDFLGVAPDVRRRGLAGELISAAVNWLFTLPEVEAVTLTVAADNTAALALYARLGFTQAQTLQAFRKQY